MDELLEALEKLYSIPGNSYTSEDGRAYFEDNDVTDEVIGLCDEHLIADGGDCNWDNIEVLRRNGYSVFAGDEDSFGWLTGCIRKQDDERILVYG